MASGSENEEVLVFCFITFSNFVLALEIKAPSWNDWKERV